MSDDDGSAMDLCECVWGHEMAMRRLLSLVSYVYYIICTTRD